MKRVIYSNLSIQQQHILLHLGETSGSNVFIPSRFDINVGEDAWV